MSDELDRFKDRHPPASGRLLMDVATSGAYYLAVGATTSSPPTTITGGIGAIFNRVNLPDAMAQLNVVADPVKAGSLIDMGCVDRPDRARDTCLVPGNGGHLPPEVPGTSLARRPGMTAGDHQMIEDRPDRRHPAGTSLQLVDRLGSGGGPRGGGPRECSEAEVVFYTGPGPRIIPLRDKTRPGPTERHSRLSYPGLGRTKLPKFLYLAARIRPSRGHPSIEP